MKVIKVFTGLINSKPGEHLFYNGIWYKVIDVVKEVVYISEENEEYAQLTFTLDRLPFEEIDNA